MSRLVDPARIEGIVGVRRHPAEHWGRADSVEETVYVLHSQQCRDSTSDLRRCPYSLALDEGIENPENWSDWRGNEDRPVRLAIRDGFLVPAPVADETEGDADA